MVMLVGRCQGCQGTMCAQHIRLGIDGWEVSKDLFFTSAPRIKLPWAMLSWIRLARTSVAGA